MPSISSWLSDVSRRKLRIAASGRDDLRDTINLRRFVLLKNSITQAEYPPSSQSLSLASQDDHPGVLVFPDAEAVTMSLDHSHSTFPELDSEEKWLESVLETLGDDFDGEVEVEVHPVEDEDDDLDYLASAPNVSYEPWMPPYDGFARDNTPSISSASFHPPPSAVLPPHFQPPISLQLLFDSPHSHFNQPFVEPRYPEADFDLPISETSLDSESDDDDGPLTPCSGSRPSPEEQSAVEPDVYLDEDSYFLYPSELDLISPPIYYQQC